MHSNPSKASTTTGRWHTTKKIFFPYKYTLLLEYCPLPKKRLEGLKMTTPRVQISEGLSEFSRLEEFRLQKSLLSKSQSHKIKVQKSRTERFFSLTYSPNLQWVSVVYWSFLPILALLHSATCYEKGVFMSVESHNPKLSNTCPQHIRISVWLKRKVFPFLPSWKHVYPKIHHLNEKN